MLDDLCSRLTDLELQFKNSLIEKDNEILNLRTQLESERKEVQRLSARLQNVELHLKRLNPGMSVFRWTLRNYTCHSQSTEVCYSPMFLTSWDAYCCQLALVWFGPRKGRLEVGFNVHEGPNYTLLTKRFSMKVLLECIGDNNNKVIQELAPSKYAADSFNDVPGLGNGVRTAGFLSMPELKDFIINDSIYIACYVFPDGHFREFRYQGM